MRPLNQRNYSPILVTAVAATLYLATLSRHYTGDSIEYALAIELGQPAYLLDPYHPLLHPLGLVFYHLWQALGWSGPSLLPLQVLNALAGALCAGLIAAAARRLAHSSSVAVLAGLGFAVSGGTWMLSTDAEFVTPALALQLVVPWALLAASPVTAGRRAYAVALGAATVLAFLGYASGALLVPVVLAGVLLDQRIERSVRRRQALIYLATVLLLIVPLYAGFLVAWSGGDWPRVPDYFLGRGTYGQLDLLNLPHGGYAFLRSLALYPRLSLEGTTRQFLARQTAGGRMAFGLYYGLILLLAVVPLGVAARWRHRLWPAERRSLAILAVWAGLLAAFGYYWVPGDVSFWLPVLAAWWLFVALLLGVWRERPVSARAATSRRWLPLAALASLVLLLGSANALFEVLPRHDLESNHPYQVAAAAAAHTAPQDVLVTRADDLTGLYLAYFGKRQVVYAASLGRLLASAPPSLRVYAVDAEPERAGWWQALLAGSESAGTGTWHVLGGAWQPEDSTLLQLVR